MSNAAFFNLDFPYRFDTRGRSAPAAYKDHIEDLIEQVLFTGHNQRCNRPDFGCDLLQMTFEPTSLEIAATIQFTVQGALNRWLGDLIDVVSLEVTSGGDATLRVDLRYRLRGGEELLTGSFPRQAGGS